MISWIKDHLGCLLGLLVLIGLCIFLLYSWFDSRVTITYMLQEQKDQRREIEVLQSLLLQTGKRMSRSEIEQIVTKHFWKDYLIKKDEEDELSVDNVILKFEGASLVKVKSTNDD